ncbi:Hypothetical protein NTJ_00545 [Nesidiocoris tenuis]|uniref:Uncharacterized protein n=1 Tax=Nesidiocoris tenuis TaxID=355587 RepID=A0ABN7A6L2_9HEMI|nr:Hypothetical protein NTJ_00545 [Nesidiocoris tenuis]
MPSRPLLNMMKTSKDPKVAGGRCSDAMARKVKNAATTSVLERDNVTAPDKRPRKMELVEVFYNRLQLLFFYPGAHEMFPSSSNAGYIPVPGHEGAGVEAVQPLVEEYLHYDGSSEI